MRKNTRTHIPFPSGSYSQVEEKTKFEKLNYEREYEKIVIAENDLN